MNAIHFSKTHSRNAHDFNYSKDPATGRHMLVANGGVWKRTGLLVTALASAPLRSLTKAGMVEYLARKFDASYSVNDMSQPIKIMVIAGIVTQHGGRRGTYYRLTSKGAAIWAKTPKCWLGKK